MRFTILGMSALALAAVSAPAFAQDAAPASDFTVTGGATMVTDYRFRGISQTNKRFAVQGTITVAHSSGFYASIWGSSIDDYVAFGSDQEIDFIGGYSKTIGGVTLDGGVLYYYYPGSSGFNTDFFEPYLSAKTTYGPVTGKIGISYAPKQHAIAVLRSRDDNIYAYGELSGAVGPIALTSHVGYTSGESVLSGGLKNYWDWNLGASYTWNHLTFGVSYVDTDIKRSDSPAIPGFFVPSDRFIAKAGVVGSVGVSF